MGTRFRASGVLSFESRPTYYSVKFGLDVNVGGNKRGRTSKGREGKGEERSG